MSLNVGLLLVKRTGRWRYMRKMFHMGIIAGWIGQGVLMTGVHFTIVGKGTQGGYHGVLGGGRQRELDLKHGSVGEAER